MANHYQNSSESSGYLLLNAGTVMTSTVKKTITRAIKSSLNAYPKSVTAVVLFGLLILATVGVGATQRESRTPPSGPAQMVHFTIYDAGIFPKEVRVSAGVVALHIEDMSAGSSGLVVANESLETVAQVVRRPERRRDNAPISLVSGRYTVYDASRPRNRATLIVEP